MSVLQYWWRSITCLYYLGVRTHLLAEQVWEMMVLRRRWLLKIVICDKHALDTAVSSTPPPHHQSTTTTSTIIPRTLARRLIAVDSSPGWTRGRPARGMVAACKVDRPANLLNARGLKCTCDRWAITSHQWEALPCGRSLRQADIQRSMCSVRYQRCKPNEITNTSFWRRHPRSSCKRPSKTYYAATASQEYTR